MKWCDYIDDTPCGECHAPARYHPNNPIGDDYPGHVCHEWKKP